MMGTAVKAIAIIVGVILIMSLTLVAFRMITWQFFWLIAILAAIIAYYAIPSMQKSS